MSEAYEGPCDAFDDDNREAVNEVEERVDERGEEGREEGGQQDVLDMGELGELGKPWVDAVYPQGGHCHIPFY